MGANTSAEAPANDDRKKTKKENKLEARAAEIAKLETEWPYTFWFSVDPNSSECLQFTQIGYEQDFDRWINRHAGIRLFVKDKATNKTLRSIFLFSHAVKTNKGLEANNEFLYLQDPEETLKDTMAKMKKFEKNMSVGIELQSNQAVANDQELRDALGGSPLTLLNNREQVLFWKYEKDPGTGERKISTTTGEEIKVKWVEADGFGMNDTKIVFIEAKTCVKGDHIIALRTERLNKLLKMLRELTVEPEFYKSEPPEIKVQLIEILNNKFAGKFMDPELHLQPIDRLPIALVLSGRAFTADMQRLCYEKDPTLPPTLTPNPTLTPTPTPTPTLDQTLRSPNCYQVPRERHPRDDLGRCP